MRNISAAATKFYTMITFLELSVIYVTTSIINTKGVFYPPRNNQLL